MSGHIKRFKALIKEMSPETQLHLRDVYEENPEAALYLAEEIDTLSTDLDRLRNSIDSGSFERDTLE